MKLDEKQRARLSRLAEYFAGFLSNLAVVGVGLALFKEEAGAWSLLAAFFALVLGAIIALAKRS